MYAIMRLNGVPMLARRKVACSLVGSMIGEYMKATAAASSQTIANFIGLPPSKEKKLESDHGSLEDKFKRRVEEVFCEIVPEHEHCKNTCEGHQLPGMVLKFLSELKHPSDLSKLAVEARNWFDRIDADMNGSLDHAELETELLRIGLTERQVEQVMYFHKHALGDNSSMDVDAFILLLLHVLGNAIPSLSAADMVTVAYLFNRYNETDDAKIDLVLFEKIALELVYSCFAFSGRESLDVLDVRQLDALRRHNWKRRVLQELAEGQEADNAQNAIDDKKNQFDAEGEHVLADAASGADANTLEPMFRETRQQKRSLVVICQSLRSICAENFNAHDDLLKRANALYDEEGQVSMDIAHFILELKHRLQRRVFDGADMIMPNCPSVPSLPARGQGPSVHSKDKTDPERGLPQDAYAMLIKVEKTESLLREILLEQVLDMAFKLQKEGVIVSPPLVWRYCC